MPEAGAGLFRRCFSLLGMKFLLETNRGECIADDEYFLGKGSHLHSLLSNFHRIDEIDDSGEPDLTLSIVDFAGPRIAFSKTGEGRYLIAGAISDNERACADKRSCIFGNMGLFSKLLVRELECRGIFSMHSTSFFDRGRNRLYIVMGDSGSGKSTMLLRAISMGGIEVFGTELTHFSFGSAGPKMIKGSLWQNCRMGNLVYDFPALLERFGLGVPEGDPWHAYESVSLHDIQVPEDILGSALIVLVMPRIEGERVNSSSRIVPKESLRMALFQNLSDKVTPPTFLWGKQFVPSLDDAKSQSARMDAAERFLSEASIVECRDVLSSPSECLRAYFPG
jgi:hypothetical protein